MNEQGEIRTDLSVCLEMEDVGRFNRGEEVKGLVGVGIDGRTTIPEIPLSWIIDVREISGLYWELTLKKPSIANTASQGSHWVETEDGLLCLDNDARIRLVIEAVNIAWVLYEKDDIKVVLIEGKNSDEMRASEDCEEYLKKIKRLVGAMPQREK